MAGLARPAFERRTGGASYYSKANAKLRKEGGGIPRVRAESRQYSQDEVDRVRAHWRSRAGSGGRPKRAVHVRKYFRHKGFYNYPARASHAEWIAYLADYYHVSKQEARRIDRGENVA